MYTCNKNNNKGRTSINKNSVNKNINRADNNIKNYHDKVIIIKNQYFGPI